MIPKTEFLDKYKVRNLRFVVDRFEQMIIDDIMSSDENSAKKLNKNLTSDFKQWVVEKVDGKKPVRVNVKGTVRCSPKGARILMSDLTYQNIENCKIGQEVICFNQKTLKMEIKPILEVWDNGEQDIYEVKLKTGKRIKVTSNHPLFTIGRAKHNSKPCWKEVKDLVLKQDYVACPKILDMNSKKTKYPLNEIELLGFYLGDGYMKNNHSKNSKIVVFDLSKQDKINYLSNLVQNTKLNYKITRCEYNRNQHNPSWSKGNKFSFARKDISGKKQKDDFSLMIYNLKLNDCLCDTKFIPAQFKTASYEEIYALLNGLFNSDGCVDKTKGILFSTTSKLLREDIKILLLRLGINFYEQKPKKEKEHWKQSYKIVITDFDSCLKIFLNCNLTSEKKADLEYYMDSKNPKYLSRNYHIEKEDLVFYKVMSITKIKREYTYDLTIKDNCNYVVEGVCCHNSGKSLTGLKIGFWVTSMYKDKVFDTEKIVCANQKEYRANLHKAEFGDFYLVDENAFTNVGLGMASEMFQLKDINNIIAKKNIHTIFITPDIFLNNNAEIGLSAWGNDIHNWASRFLLYSIKTANPILLGYITINIGELFRETGCYVYKETGGCTNPNKCTSEDISESAIHYSSCIPKSLVKMDKDKLHEEGQVCPFYEICSSMMCKYEHKKDTWIEKEMKGGLDERQKEVYYTAIKILRKLGRRDIVNDRVVLYVSNAKEYKEKVLFYAPTVSNTKFTLAEQDRLVNNVRMLIDKDFYIEMCAQLELNLEKELKLIPLLDSTEKKK